MTRPAVPANLGSEFNDFLFAQIGADGNGMQISVLSALARLDVDPWVEARTLAGLPGQIATERLAAFIAELPGRSSEQGDEETIAARLIVLLPRPAGSASMPQKTPLRAGLGANPGVVLYVLFMVVALGTQWIVANHQAPPPTDSPDAPIASTASQPPDTPNAAR